MGAFLGMYVVPRFSFEKGAFLVLSDSSRLDGRSKFKCVKNHQHYLHFQLCCPDVSWGRAETLANILNVYTLWSQNSEWISRILSSMPSHSLLCSFKQFVYHFFFFFSKRLLFYFWLCAWFMGYYFPSQGLNWHSWKWKCGLTTRTDREFSVHLLLNINDLNIFLLSYYKLSFVTNYTEKILTLKSVSTCNQILKFSDFETDFCFLAVHITTSLPFGGKESLLISPADLLKADRNVFILEHHKKWTIV